MIELIILAAVLILITVRRIGRARLRIWQIMLGGALTALLLGRIGILDAARAINMDIILFLIGMFVIGEALSQSGFLAHITYTLFRRAKSSSMLLLMIILCMGVSSAILMNDTLAIIGTPVMILLARKHDLPSGHLLIALAFAVTIGSVMSPIGNPQNLLIAMDGNMTNPFIVFFTYLAVPTILSLLVTYLILRLAYRDHFNNGPITHSQEPIKDHRLANLSKVSLSIILALIAAKIILFFFGRGDSISLTMISTAGALPILCFSAKRATIVRRLDWHTVIFFCAMFVLMRAVWDGGIVQSWLETTDVDILSLPLIFAAGILGSQLISNVPLVALYLPVLQHAGATTMQLVALAAASTIAGNMLILGAASNVIIIQAAENQGERCIRTWDFAKIGIPLTLLTAIIYASWLALVS
ncbi:MAG: SLC13 family permease [Nanoarchaeota archaeon]